MRYRKFGRTGIEISDIAPGLWGMGGWSGSGPDRSRISPNVFRELIRGAADENILVMLQI